MKLYLRLNESAGYTLMTMDSNEDIALNVSHDNLENPTNYISEYVYNLKVPVCAANNRLFSNFVHLDSLVISGGYNPAVRMDYIILDNSGSLISTGKAYVKDISGGYYNLALTGSLSRIFSKLLNSGWDETNEDSDYTLLTDWLGYSKSGADTFTLATNVINKDVVYATWMVDSPVFDWDTLRSTRLLTTYNLSRGSATETQCWIASIVGFAPTAQGLLPEFSNDKWIEAGTVDDVSTSQLAMLPVLCSERDSDYEPIVSVNTDDGMREAQMGEYRSYYQQPFIYIHRLWQMYQEEFSSITEGYSLILDDRWFTDDNPRLAGLVYMLPRLFDEGEGDIIEEDALTDISFTDTLPSGTYTTSSEPYTVSGVDDVASAYVTPTQINKTGEKISYTFNVSVTITPNQTMPSGATFYASPYNFLLLNLRVRDNSTSINGETVIMAEHKLALVLIPEDSKVTMDTYLSNVTLKALMRAAQFAGYKITEVPYTPGSTSINFEFTDTLTAINTRSNVSVDTASTTPRLSATIRYATNYTPWMYVYGGMTLYTYDGQGTVGVDLTDIAVKRTNATRTEKVLSLGNLFRDEKPFSVLLKYSKMMHLVWQVDDDAKTVTVKASQDFFKDIISSGGDGITDLTDVVDKGMGMTIAPLSWTENKVQFNIASTDLDYLKDYEENFGITYGSKTLVTSRKIDTATKTLLCNSDNDTIAPSAMISERLYPVGQLYNQAKVFAGYVDNDPMPLNMSGGESADHHGCFYFRHTNDYWNDRLMAGWRNDGTPFVYITDDLDFESNRGEWAWHGIDALSDTYAPSWVKCYKRPVFDTTSADGSTSVHFAAVRELYYDQQTTPDNYLYEDVWKDYIEEVYNIQNKTVTLYAHISKAVFDIIKSDPLVQIGNVLYLLTKIEGWGEHAAVCRLTLRQIYDLEALAGTTEIVIEEGNYILCEDESELVTENDEYLIIE